VDNWGGRLPTALLEDNRDGSGTDCRSTFHHKNRVVLHSHCGSLSLEHAVDLLNSAVVKIHVGPLKGACETVVSFQALPSTQ
jgi:hypothetical protein